MATKTNLTEYLCPKFCKGVVKFFNHNVTTHLCNVDSVRSLHNINLTTTLFQITSVEMNHF